MREGSCDLCGYSVQLQNCVGFVDVETGYFSETCVTCDGDGTEEVGIKAEDTIALKEEVSIKVEENIHIKEEVSIKVEVPLDIKDEIQEAIPFPPVKTEHEVRLRGVCELVAAHVFRPIIALQKEIVVLHLTICCFVLFCGCHVAFEIWIAI